jgi:hypothetical protein
VSKAAGSDAGDIEIQTKTLKRVKKTFREKGVEWCEAAVLAAAVEEYKYAIVVDMSPSMRIHTKAGISRWQEAIAKIGLIAHLATVANDDGTVGLYFTDGSKETVTNTDEAHRVCKAKQLSGRTPLCRTFKRVLKDHADKSTKLCVIFLTDGVPHGGKHETIGHLQKLVADAVTAGGKVAVQFAMCTDDASVVGNYDAFDRKHPSIDVTDDYETERRQVLALEGVTTFTKWDYAVKLMLPMVKRWDELDEAPCPKKKK